MGSAVGRFLPVAAYREAQPLIVAASTGSQDHLALSVQTSDGRVLPAQGGVQIVDFSADLGTEGIEVHVLGIPYPLYEELFPGRHAEYVAGFQKRV